jgi:hypothetical protein
MPTAQPLVTLADWQKSTDPQTGKQQMMAEVLHQSNPLVGHFKMAPSNLPTGHVEPIRTDLPEVHLKRVNEGVPSSKSTRSQITESISLLESWAIHEEDALKMSGDMVAARRSEVDAHLESMAQKQAELLIYGSQADDPRMYNGLTVRYDDMTSNTAPSIHHCGSISGDNTSVWIVGHGLGKIFTVYPKDTMGGLYHRDFELDAITDPAGSGYGSETMAGYRDQLKWHCGLVVKDWRYAQRLCAIDMDDWTSAKGTQAVTEWGTAVPFVLSRALKRIPVKQAVDLKIYMSRSGFEAFDTQCQAMHTQNVVKTEEIDGVQKDTWRGVEITVVDQIRHNEALPTT